MNIETILTVIVAVGGATWALRSKLSDIEMAIKSHVASDAEQFEAMNARVIKLESKRGRR